MPVRLRMAVMEDFLIRSYCVPLAVVGPGEVTLLKTLWDPWEMAGPGPSRAELSFAQQTLLGQLAPKHCPSSVASLNSWEEQVPLVALGVVFGNSQTGHSLSSSHRMRKPFHSQSPLRLSKAPFGTGLSFLSHPNFDIFPLLTKREPPLQQVAVLNVIILP